MPIDLEKLYSFINKKFYGNKLPVVPIKYAKRMPLKGSVGVTTFKGNKAVKITILDVIGNMGVFGIQTVIHEMAHVAMGRRAGHGPKFRKELLRLHKAGAYDGLL